MVEEGEPAPSFTLSSDMGEEVSLESFRGTPVVLYFYPRNDTSGCTAQACELRDDHAAFEERGAVILGVSPDDVTSHARFKAKHELPFTLLADPDNRVAKLYGAWGEKVRYGKRSVGLIRSTFVIAPDGTVVAALRNVRATGHAASVLAVLPDAVRS